MVEENLRVVHYGEEHDLFMLQQPGKEVILKKCLAFKDNLTILKVKEGK